MTMISSKLTLILLLVLVQGIINSHAETAEELIKIANEAKSPFSQVALERMNNTELWGVNRAMRTFDVVIINESGFKFVPIEPECFKGFFSPGLTPETLLNEYSSTVLGIQSSKDDESGVDITCNLDYTDLVDTVVYIKFDSTARATEMVSFIYSSNFRIWRIVDDSQIIIKLSRRNALDTYLFPFGIRKGTR